MLEFATLLLIFIGFIHSILGEKYILIRLFRRDNLPHLMGSDWFTKQTLRFAWHITTLAWWGFACMLFIMSNEQNIETLKAKMLWVIVSVFLISGIISLIFSRAKHLSWIVFLLISLLCFLAI